MSRPTDNRSFCPDRGRGASGMEQYHRSDDRNPRDYDRRAIHDSHNYGNPRGYNQQLDGAVGGFTGGGIPTVEKTLLNRAVPGMQSNSRRNIEVNFVQNTGIYGEKSLRQRGYSTAESSNEDHRPPYQPESSPVYFVRSEDDQGVMPHCSSGYHPTPYAKPDQLPKQRNDTRSVKGFNPQSYDGASEGFTGGSSTGSVEKAPLGREGSGMQQYNNSLRRNYEASFIQNAGKCGERPLRPRNGYSTGESSTEDHPSLYQPESPPSYSAHSSSVPNPLPRQRNDSGKDFRDINNNVIPGSYDPRREDHRPPPQSNGREDNYWKRGRGGPRNDFDRDASRQFSQVQSGRREDNHSERGRGGARDDVHNDARRTFSQPLCNNNYRDVPKSSGGLHDGFDRDPSRPLPQNSHREDTHSERGRGGTRDDVHNDSRRAIPPPQYANTYRDAAPKSTGGRRDDFDRDARHPLPQTQNSRQEDTHSERGRGGSRDDFHNDARQLPQTLTNTYRDAAPKPSGGPRDDFDRDARRPLPETQNSRREDTNSERRRGGTRDDVHNDARRPIPQPMYNNNYRDAAPKSTGGLRDDAHNDTRRPFTQPFNNNNNNFRDVPKPRGGPRDDDDHNRFSRLSLSENKPNGPSGNRNQGQNDYHVSNPGRGDRHNDSHRGNAPFNPLGFNSQENHHRGYNDRSGRGGSRNDFERRDFRSVTQPQRYDAVRGGYENQRHKADSWFREFRDQRREWNKDGEQRERMAGGRDAVRGEERGGMTNREETGYGRQGVYGSQREERDEGAEKYDSYGEVRGTMEFQYSGRRVQSNFYNRDNDDFQKLEQPVMRAPPGWVPKEEALDELFRNDKLNVSQSAQASEETIVTGDEGFKEFDSWESSGLHCHLIDVLKNKCGFEKPRKIQAAAIEEIMAGRDLVAQAMTGSGKTFAFVLPIVDKIMKMTMEERGKSAHAPLAIVLEPTRELAVQVYDAFRRVTHDTNIRCMCVIGQMDRWEIRKSFFEGVDIYVGTGGRLQDLHGRGDIDLHRLRFFVMDEADRNLNHYDDEHFRQFIETQDFRKTATQRQTLLFSATLPQECVEMAKKIMKKGFVRIENKDTKANGLVEQVYVETKGKLAKNQALKKIFRKDKEEGKHIKTLIFVDTRKQSDFLAFDLMHMGFGATSINGDRPQDARDETYRKFMDGTISILVGTDVCSRGWDVPTLQRVINYDLPIPRDNVAESCIDKFIHRIGRTGRVKEGTAISFVDPFKDAAMAKDLVAICREVGQTPPDFLLELAGERVASHSTIELDPFKPAFSQCGDSRASSPRRRRRNSNCSYDKTDESSRASSPRRRHHSDCSYDKTDESEDEVPNLGRGGESVDDSHSEGIAEEERKTEEKEGETAQEEAACEEKKSVKETTEEAKEEAKEDMEEPSDGEEVKATEDEKDDAVSERESVEVCEEEVSVKEETTEEKEAQENEELPSEVVKAKEVKETEKKVSEVVKAEAEPTEEERKLEAFSEEKGEKAEEAESVKQDTTETAEKEEPVEEDEKAKETEEEPSNVVEADEVKETEAEPIAEEKAEEETVQPVKAEQEEDEVKESEEKSAEVSKVKGGQKKNKKKAKPAKKRGRW